MRKDRRVDYAESRADAGGIEVRGVASKRRAQLVLALTALGMAGGFGWPELAGAQGYTHAAIALPGDAAPVAGQETYSSFGAFVSINNSGEVAFYASVTGGIGGGIFVGSQVGQRAVALVGDPAPGTGGGTYSGFYSDALAPINSSGDVAFIAFVTGGSVSQGIFVDSGGTDRSVVVLGDTAPSTGGGTYSSFHRFPSINDAGDVAFESHVAGGTATIGFFADSSGTQRAIAFPGDPAPGGGTYFNLFTDSLLSINDSGDVAFRAVVDNGGGHGIFVDSGGTDRVVARNSDPAPGTGGGSYVQSILRPSINPSGDVAFVAGYSGGTVGGGTGVFAEIAGTDLALALQSTTAPGTGGEVYTNFFDSFASINASGDVAFWNNYSGSADQGIFLVSGGTDSLITSTGDPAPGTGDGETYGTFRPYVALNDSGAVAFGSFVSGFGRGIFVASPSLPQVPAISPGGRAILGLFLVAVGALLASRRARGA
jgi:hypothetical protein